MVKYKIFRYQFMPDLNDKKSVEEFMNKKQFVFANV